MASRFDPPRPAIVEAVARALAEDLLPLGDLTSALLPETHTVRTAVTARTDGVLAGTTTFGETFAQLDSAVSVTWSAKDGDRVSPGMVLGHVSGDLATVLTGERTALNFLGHLSGIATFTRRFVDAIAATGSSTRLWDTRKTTPGLRSLEKAAVRAGGAANHRGNLSDWILLKDNHLAGIGITVAVERARSVWPGRTIHVECDTLDQVDEALVARADALLLDNMSPADVRAAIDRRSKAGVTCLLEASGGITLDTVAAYAATGVDHVSTGAITNSAPVLDLGLDLLENH